MPSLRDNYLDILKDENLKRVVVVLRFSIKLTTRVIKCAINQLFATLPKLQTSQLRSFDLCINKTIKM